MQTYFDAPNTRRAFAEGTQGFDWVHYPEDLQTPVDFEELFVKRWSTSYTTGDYLSSDERRMCGGETRQSSYTLHLQPFVTLEGQDWYLENLNAGSTDLFNLVRSLYPCADRENGVRGSQYNINPLVWLEKDELEEIFLIGQSSTICYSHEYDLWLAQQATWDETVEDFWELVSKYELDRVLAQPSQKFKQANVEFVKANIQAAYDRACSYHGSMPNIVAEMVNHYADGSRVVSRNRTQVRTMIEDLEAKMSEQVYSDDWLDDFMDDYA